MLTTEQSDTSVSVESVGYQPSKMQREVSLIGLLTVLLRRKRFLCLVSLTAGISGGVIASLVPPSFKAEATILTPQPQQSSLAGLAGSVGGLTGASMASQLGLKNPADLYIGMLQSRTIADDIIHRFRLEQVYKTKLASGTRAALAGRVSFSSGKDSLIKITAVDHDPKRAADLANAFVDELYLQNSRLATTSAGQRRLFFEQQLGRERDALTEAETSMKSTEQSTGLIAPAGQAELLLHSGAQFRAEIASREIQLQAMRSYATDENPQIQVLKSEISALQSQLNQIENRQDLTPSTGVSAARLPALTLQAVRAMREVKYHETLYELLAKQYEAARIDEAKEGPAIQVVDRAVIPDHKTSPKRSLFMLGGATIAFILACVWSLFAHAIRGLSADPDAAAQLQMLGNALRF